MNTILPFIGLLALSLLSAAWLGAAPERIAAALYLAGIVGSAAAGPGPGPGNGFRELAAVLLLVDTMLAVALTLLTLRANRLWLIFATSCQWLAVLSHITRWLAPGIIPTSYAFLTVIWSWPMVALLLGGTIVNWWRARAGHRVPTWRSS